MFIIVPDFCFFITGVISFVNNASPNTLTLKTFKKSLIFRSSIEDLTPIPTLLIKTSTLLSKISKHFCVFFLILSISPISNSITFILSVLKEFFNLTSDLPVIKTFHFFNRVFNVSFPIPKLPPVKIIFLSFKFILNLL